MARKDSDLTTCMIVSDYNPAHYNWPKEELATLGNCKAIAEVIKALLENHGLKIKEMYIIEHTGEKKADSQTRDYHRAVDETKTHYHIIIKFEPSHGATLKDIARFIGVPLEVIGKPHSGRFSYDNMLSYLTHIKYGNKIQYAPEDVVTLAGTDYMDYYNERSERWKKARPIVAKKGGKTRKRRYQDAEAKLDSGELTYEELADTEEYCDLLTDLDYGRKLRTKSNLVKDACKTHFANIEKAIASKKITTWEEIEAREKFNLLLKYDYEQKLKKALENELKNALRSDLQNLLQGIEEDKINLFPEEIAACDEYKALCQFFKEDIETALRKRAEREYSDLYYDVINHKITVDEIRASEKYKFAYLYFKNEIEAQNMPRLPKSKKTS